MSEDSKQQKADQKPEAPAWKPEGLELPSMFINRFNVLVGPELSRLVFGETVIGDQTKFHIAITMTTAHVKEFAMLLLQLAASTDQQLEEIKKKASESGANVH